MKEMRANNREGLPDLVTGYAKRIGIKKRGDSFALSCKYEWRTHAPGW